MEVTLLILMRWRVLFSTMTFSGLPSHLAITFTREAASAGRTARPLSDEAGPSKATSVSTPTSEANNTKDTGRTISFLPLHEQDLGRLLSPRRVRIPQMDYLLLHFSAAGVPCCLSCHTE